MTPILASGQSEVSEIDVALRNDDVTSTIMTMVKAMNRLNPASPSVLRATSAIDRPPSRMLMNSVVKSWTAPMKIAAQDDPEPGRDEAVEHGHGRAQDRPGAGDGREVVGENDVGLGRNVVAAVAELDGRRGIGGILPRLRAMYRE